ncbi:kinase-like protein [Lepidopterella palustris CBS 459.81]|uniref:non-specific serine/threonine protein kinase n=1 Tax=Lepidopterella palustris CBS 459.81 TaxID=1314670 RepID=A0A8E2E3M9_9PEZI|nr:kinase-like protein [Lepidopterella palustris CBS 459.81]
MSTEMPHFGDFPSPNHTWERQLQKGSEGTVHLFTHKPSASFFVVKHMKSKPDVIPMDVQVLRHTRNAASIVKLLGFRRNSRTMRDSILLEYCPHGDLHDHNIKHAKARTDYTEETLWRVFLQLSQALAFLHTGFGSGKYGNGWMPIIHRDIKPENVLISRINPSTGAILDIKLADFGLAAFYDPESDWMRKGAGTSCWWPPEQNLENCSATPAGDVWAIGALIHAMAHTFMPIEDPEEFARWWVEEYGWPREIEEEGMSEWFVWEAMVPRKVVSINIPIEQQTLGSSERDRRARPTPRYSSLLNHHMMRALAMDPAQRISALALSIQLEIDFDIFKAARKREAKKAAEAAADRILELKRERGAAKELEPEAVNVDSVPNSDDEVEDEVLEVKNLWLGRLRRR